MGCWRFDLRRKFVPYLEGRIPPGEAKRLEKHMCACRHCQVLFVRLRAGHRWAQELGHIEPEAVPVAPEFAAGRAEVAGAVAGRRRWARLGESWIDALITPRGVLVLSLLVLAQSALLVVSNRKALFGERAVVAAKPGALDVRDFHPLRIPELPSNTKTRIATEGYVRNVHVDEEENTLHFLLAEIPEGSGPFVVCEIMSPLVMSIPREGSRVRVYGVARYDAQPGRHWHEVNPVLNIDVLQR